MIRTTATQDLGPPRSVTSAFAFATADGDGDGADDWPHTWRLLPWLLAGFLAMLYLLPIDVIQFHVDPPFDPRPDRFAIVGLVLLWLAVTFTARGQVASRPARGARRAILVYLTIAVTSVLLNLETLARLDEIELAQRRLFLLFSFAALFYIAVASIKPSELRNFAILLVVLGCITAVGTLWEFRTDFNAFYAWSKDLLGSIAEVPPPPSDVGQPRELTVGPTQHGLAVACLLTFALPFAVVGLMDCRSPRTKVLYGVAVCLLVAASMATLRKTGAVGPLVAVGVLVAYRPRKMLALAPLAVILVIAVAAIAPAAIGTVVDQFSNGFFENGSTEARTSDYAALEPDITAHPLLGRGYGSLDPIRADSYRILDNEYLGQVFQVGFIGLAAYLLMIGATLAIAHPVARSRDPTRSSYALAAAAGCAVFGVVTALFDVLSFPQVPYMFFFLAGMITVAASRGAGRAEVRGQLDTSHTRGLLAQPEAG